VPSGTMSNLIALMIHARNKSVILGEHSHIVRSEQGGLSTIGRLILINLLLLK